MTQNNNKIRPSQARTSGNENAVQPMKQTSAVSRKSSVKTRIKKVTRLKGQVDRPFLILVVLLVCIGCIMVFSASYPYAEGRNEPSFKYAKRQLWCVLGGMVVMGGVSLFGDYRLLKNFTLTVFLVALALNVATAIPGIGLARNGARRWLNIGIDFQPSEILKFTVILMCAKHASDNKGELNNFKKGILPFLIILGMAAVPVILQRHLSCTIIVTCIVFAMMWMGGSPAGWLIGSAGAGVLALLGVLNSEKMVHSIQRFKVWDNPFNYLSGKGWQPAQSLYAISAGGFWGLGLGQSNQKHGYLPEPHNDYIFSILCEELGYFGAIVVIGLFVALIWRGMYIAKRAISMYSALIVSGIICSLAFHVILNIAVVTNSIPSTGIGLPFFSYGGTSVIIWLAEMGVVLSVSRYSYLKQE